METSLKKCPKCLKEVEDELQHIYFMIAKDGIHSTRMWTCDKGAVYTLGPNYRYKKIILN